MNAPDESDPYAVLGVKRTATLAQINAAFRRQAKASHPDKHAAKSDLERNAFEAQFRRAKWAHDILSNAEERAYYDRHGSTRERVAGDEPSKVDNTLREAFRQVVQSIRYGDAVRTDLVYQIRLWITDRRIELRGEIGRLKQVADEMQRLRGRFLRNDDPENTMSRMLDADFAQLTRVIEGKTAEADHLKDCLDELQHWRFRTTAEDEREPTRRLLGATA